MVGDATDGGAVLLFGMINGAGAGVVRDRDDDDSATLSSPSASVLIIGCVCKLLIGLGGSTTEGVTVRLCSVCVCNVDGVEARVEILSLSSSSTSFRPVTIACERIMTM